MSRCRLASVLVGAALAACGGGSSGSSTSGDSQVIAGSERFGWDQRAIDAAELASFQYAMYVDDQRSEAADVRCANTASASGFACSCRLPAVPTGTHTLQIAAFIVDAGAIRESPRSAGVRVTVAAR